MGCTFKGYNLDDYGVIFEKMPAIKKPKRRTEDIYIDNKDGYKPNELGYDGYTSECIAILTESEHFDFLKGLFDGTGALIRNDDPTRFINAKILNEVEYQVLGNALKATFEFTIEHPFRYLVTDVPQVITTFPNTITNNGNVYSKPYLTIEGSGSVTVTINGTTFSYNFPVSEDVEMDCEVQDSYHEGILRNQYMSGYYPRLEPGSNAISITGSVTSVKVENATRWL